jgi:uncharacterized protein YbaP (TraB family)
MKTNNNPPKHPHLFSVAFIAVLGLMALFTATPTRAGDESALFWSIERDGEQAGYLLGTIHSEDPRVLDFSEAFIGMLSANHVFAMEMVPDLPTLQRLTEFMQYQDGTTLEGRVGPDRYARLQLALARYRVPAEWIAGMKVWAAMMTLSIPPPETGLFMDFSLSLRAAGAGLRVVGLEALEEQLAFLEEMPMEQQMELLDQALAEYPRAQEVHDQMVESYLGGDLLALQVQAEEQLSLLDPEARRYFMHRGIDLRNQNMMESLEPLLNESHVFVAVGALHLPGENGLLQLLRGRGFVLNPLPLPFNAAEQVSAPEPMQLQRN